MNDRYVEIKLTKCRLFLTESELQSLLARDPELWRVAIKRGKHIKRAQARRPRKEKAILELPEIRTSGKGVYGGKILSALRV